MEKNKNEKNALICAILLTATVFASCGGNNTSNKTTDTTASAVVESTHSTSSEETTPPAVDVPIFESGATQYHIVRSADASSNVVAAAVELKSALDQAYGVTMLIRNDLVASGEEIYDYEILVGNVDREEYAAADELLNYNDTVVMMSGNKIIISGGSDDSTVEAVNYFIEKYITGDALVVKSDLLDIQKGNYTTLKLGTVDLSEYTIVYNTAYRDVYKEVAQQIGKAYGIKMDAIRDVEGSAEYEIIIGSALRSGEHKDLGEDDFTVEIKDNDVHIYGGSKHAVETACARFLDALGASADVSLNSVAVSYTLPDRQVYINDISKFALDWELYHETPEWMLDFDEKLAAFYDPDGRMMSMVHRGTTTNYYPENSAEGLISCIMLGIDYVEVDIRETKDGVLVLMHDATLTRMTDVESKKGKNGLPDSVNLEDWTYDQLMQLNLRRCNGGTSAEVTPYKIPTFEEILKISVNRIFILTDVKPTSTKSKCMSYVNDMWPLLEKYNAYLSVPFFWWEEMTNKNYAVTKEYFERIEDITGKKAPVILATSKYSDLEAYNHFYGFSMIAKLGSDFATYSYKTYFEEYGSAYKNLKGKVRIFTFAYNGSGSPFPENKESFEFYSALLEHGVNLPVVEKGYLMAQFIAQNCQPTK